MLTAILAVWLGLWGPVNLAALQQWQPMMAALIALGAATMAYRGATSKTRFDQMLLEKETFRKKLAIYLRLHLALRHLSARSRRVASRLDSHSWYLGETTIAVGDITIDEPREFEMVWEMLDLFPSEIITRLARIRTILANQKRRRETLEVDHWNFPAGKREFPPALISFAASSDELWRTSLHVSEALGDMIVEYVPDLPIIKRRLVDTLRAKKMDD
jgi:hypothetical protein